LVEREPFYALSDLTVQSREVPHEAIVTEIMLALGEFLQSSAAPQRSGE
jgi:shikimate kinase